MLTARLLSALGFVILLSGVLTGCDTVTRKGDVNYVIHKTTFTFLPAVEGSSVSFPPIDLGYKHSITLRVRDLPTAIFPQFGYLDIPSLEDNRYIFTQPWRTAVLRVRLADVNGGTFYEDILRFNKWEGASQSGKSSSRRDAVVFLTPFQRTDWHGAKPQQTSYDVTFVVQQPSRRHTDRLRVGATRP